MGLQMKIEGKRKQPTTDAHTKESWLQEKRKQLSDKFNNIKGQIATHFTESLKKACESFKKSVNVSGTFKDLFKSNNREDAKDQFLKQALTPKTTKPTATATTPVPPIKGR